MNTRSDRPSPLDEARLRQQAIGAKLRQMFDEVVSEPVPDDFLEILKAADAREVDGHTSKDGSGSRKTP